MDDLPDKKLLRIDEVADYFGVSERTIRLWIEHKILECEKTGGIIRISKKAIEKCRMRSIIKSESG